MQINPIEEWQRLTEHYRRMSDDALCELAVDFADLTPTAQQALGGEMRIRGLGDPATTPQPTPMGLPEDKLPLGNAPSDLVDNMGFGTFGARSPEIAPDNLDTQDADGPHDYTWKTPLCECETGEEAWQLSAALKVAGIECWIEGAGKYSPYSNLDLPRPRLLVAADQLDQARMIAAQPIPQEIVEESRTPLPEFEAPRCPRCGAEDPLLESVDPTNRWHCESCDAEWTEAWPAHSETDGKY